MSRIKGKNTKPEILVRKFLFSKGFRFRLHDKNLPGKPDIVLKKYNAVVFVNGCFWHGHSDCRYAVIPKTRTEWWTDKINKTKERDQTSYEALISKGWNIIVIWECELKPGAVKQTLNNLVSSLYSQ